MKTKKEIMEETAKNKFTKDSMNLEDKEDILREELSNVLYISTKDRGYYYFDEEFICINELYNSSASDEDKKKIVTWLSWLIRKLPIKTKDI